MWLPVLVSFTLHVITCCVMLQLEQKELCKWYRNLRSIEMCVISNCNSSKATGARTLKFWLHAYLTKGFCLGSVFQVASAKLPVDVECFGRYSRSLTFLMVTKKDIEA